MKIAVIGAGFTGLTASYYLSQKGHKVTVYEKEKNVGGIASGIREDHWAWYLDKYYHHIFTSDEEVKKIAKEVGVNIFFSRPKTKNLVNNKIFSLDSPIDVLKFSKLSFIERLRMGFALAYFKINPFWKWMESIPTGKYLPKIMGSKAYKTLWKPLLSSKFGKYKNQIPLSWFWARIKKRSSSLGYPEKGFQNLAEKIKDKAEKNGVNFCFQNEIKKISKEKSFIKVSKDLFDKVIYTAPLPLFIKITEGLPKNYSSKIKEIKTLAFLNLILILDQPFLKDGTYWLNICDENFPFLSVTEHTNFIDKSYYGNQHIVYIGKYLSHEDPYLAKPKDELLKIYNPFLKRINKDYESSIIDTKLFVDLYAQPIISLSYSKILPSFKTPIENLYLACMHQVYPWDRGTNYAVELGEKVAKLLINNQ